MVHWTSYLKEQKIVCEIYQVDRDYKENQLLYYLKNRHYNIVELSLPQEWRHVPNIYATKIIRNRSKVNYFSSYGTYI